MNQAIVFKDQQDLADLSAFLQRAKRLDERGAVKLRCFGDVLAAYVSPIYSGSLIAEGPTVLGLRTMQLAKSLELDSTFEISSLLERMSSPAAMLTASVSIPPAGIRVAWSGITPPRQGWEHSGEIAQELVSQWAKDGIAEVASALPESVGSAIAARVRLQIWGRSVGLEYNLPAATAFAMAGLGFLEKGVPVQVFRTAGWVRLSSKYGHVLSKESFRIS
ncbi:MAG: hypothetical protein RL696_644 [Actinomycetota bacterium]